MISVTVLLMLMVMQMKHFLCDFVWQFDWMVIGKGRATDWVGPLTAHSAVHAVGCFGVLAIYNSWIGPDAGLPWGCAAIIAATDGAVHFVIDRLKAHPKVGGRWKLPQAQFWMALGADQMAHHLCGILIAIWAYTNTVVLAP